MITQDMQLFHASVRDNLTSFEAKGTLDERLASSKEIRRLWRCEEKDEDRSAVAAQIGWH